MSDSSEDERLHYLRTELLERIAHELRGPAGVTLGALDELEHALGDQAEQHRALLAMARRGAKRVLRTAERLTRTALLESGVSAASRGPSDVRTLVRKAVEYAEQIEGRASVKVALRVPDEPCIVELDAGWWSIAFGELVSQAVRGARGEVEIHVEVDTNAVRVRVRDDRRAPVDFPASRFVAMKDRRDAALGWPLVHDVARAHEAALIAEPVHDEAGVIAGARVTIELPRQSAEQVPIT